MDQTQRNRHSLYRWIAVSVCIVLLGQTSLLLAAVKRQKTVERLQDATTIFSEVMNIPEGSIPHSLLRDSHAILIIPGVIKGAFIVGARHGKGVMLTKMPGGRWSNPCFMSISGGSVGCQLGGQRVDLILVITNKKGVEGIFKSNFSLSGDATVSAGPVGRNAEAGTDLTARASILSYSRSKGLFAGVSLAGAVLNVDESANYAFYQKLVDKRKILFDPSMPVPAEVQPLHRLLKPFAGVKSK